MQQPNDTKIFTGVMDTDSAPFNINQVDVRYRLNLINLYNDQGFGSNENVVSFLPLFNQFLTTAPQKCLGCFEDVRGNSIIFFIYSADKKHGIYRWYQEKGTNGTIEKIYQVQDVNNDCLNFQEDNLISHVSLVDELLIWTDGYNEPRCMNIVRANTTNKQRVFNLYFDQAAFVSSPATTYTLKVYTSTTQTFTWQSTSLNYVDRVQDFINAVSATPFINQYIHVENKVNYAQITLVDVGDYMIEVTPSAYVVAENFYPDVTPTAYSYAPLNSELITAVKYPPMCSPDVKYIATSLEPKLNVLYQTTTTDPFKQQSGWVGIINNSTNGYYDNLGISVVGASNITNQPPVSTPAPLSYFINTTPNNIQVQFFINVNPTFGTLQGFSLIFGKYINSSTPPIGNPPNGYTIYANSGQVAPITISYVQTLAPNEKWGFYVFSSLSEVTLNINVQGQIVQSSFLNTITSQAYQFRTQYIYKDNQESVFSAISRIPTPTSVFDTAIEIDFSDPRLNSLELVSDIKEVVIAYTNDNKTTWFEYIRLQPYQFIDNQKYIFKADLLGIPIDNASINREYDNIPLIAKSQEFIDDRVFYGAITTGYNTIPIDINLSLSYVPLSTLQTIINSRPPLNYSSYRRGGKYFFGLVYYDDADRKTGVIIDSDNSNLSIPNFEPNISQPDNALAPPKIDWQINHEPPSWATKYQWVRTLDLSQSNYLMWRYNKAEYVDDNFNVVGQTLGTYIKLDFSNFPFYTQNTQLGTKISFPYVDCDVIKFITGSGTTLTTDNEHSILRVDGTDVYIRKEGLLPNGILAGQLCVIYSINKVNLDSVFYEFSECYEIKESVFDGITRKYHTGSTTNQSYGAFAIANTPATGTFTIGDVFYRTRTFPIGINPPLYGFVSDFISSDMPSDYIEPIPNSPYNNNGRVNITDLIGQLYQPTGVVFTNRYVSNTKINGLNSVEGANIRQYSTIYGDLNCMRVLNNDILRLVFGNGYQLSLYVNQGVIRQSGGGANLVSIYDDVAGNSHIIQKSLGTLNAESCVINDEADLFGWDETEGVDWLSASNDLVQVSEYKMMNVFNDYGQARRLLDRKKSHTPAVYDLTRDLMVLTLNTLQPQQYIAPSFIVKLPDLSNTTDWAYGINIHPNNASYYEFNPSSVKWYDLFASSLSQLGQFTLIQNADGSFKVEAPSFVGYNNSVLVLSAYNKIQNKFYTYSYSFLGGQQESNLPTFQGVTIAYNRKQQGWQTYFSYLPEMYGRLRNQVISFDNGILYLHDRGVGYNNFYGQQYRSQINFILNKDYPKVKTPLSLWYRGTGTWAAKVGYSPNNMETEMLPANWRLQENGYSTEVLRDKNDPSFTNPLEAWVNGQEIRGDYIEIELYNDENTFAAIDSEKTIYTYSEIS
jgi:hypothetical protein